MRRLRAFYWWLHDLVYPGCEKIADAYDRGFIEGGRRAIAAVREEVFGETAARTRA